MNKKISLKKGFSLVEVLITLVVLSIGILSVSKLMVYNIKTYQTAKNQIVASLLAQEGIELVRNFKDNGKVLADGNDYVVDRNTAFTSFVDDPTSSKKLFLFHDLFTHWSGLGAESTIFFRKISIKINSGNVEATAYVTWNGTGLPDGAVPTDYCTVANKCIAILSVLP